MTSLGRTSNTHPHLRTYTVPSPYGLGAFCEALSTAPMQWARDMVRRSALLEFLHFFVSGHVSRHEPRAWVFGNQSWRPMAVFPACAAVAALALCICAAISPSSVLNAPFAVKAGYGIVVVSVLTVGRRLYRRSKRRFCRLLAASGFRMCLQCGYSLTGSSDHGSCPECGRSYRLDDVVAAWTQWAADN